MEVRQRRLIRKGIGKNLYPLTLKSWKQAKKELAKTDILQKLNYSKAS